MEKSEFDVSFETINLSKHFPIKRRGLISSKLIGDIKAVNGINLKIKRGEILGLVGESGSGKTTMARVILNLISPSGGDAIFISEDYLDDDKINESDKHRARFSVFSSLTRADVIWFRNKSNALFCREDLH